jgi:hypothetical protein
MNQKKSLFALLTLTLGLLTLNGCKPLYLPNPANVPMLAEKGEANVQLTLGTSVLDAGVAYSPINHLGIAANISGSAGTINHHILFEGAAGYYARTSKNVIVDVYGGFGAGDTHAEETSLGSTTEASARFWRVYLQPSVGFRAKVFEANFAMRTCFVRMQEYSETSLILFAPSSNVFIEPMVTSKLGWKGFKFLAQIGFSVPTQALTFEYNPFLFNVGFNIGLGKNWDNE